MINLNFNIENQRLQINLATFPEGCNSVVMNLPDGKHLAHHFSERMMVDASSMLENLPGLIGEFVEYLEICEDRKENTLKGYRKRLGQFTDWLQQQGYRRRCARILVRKLSRLDAMIGQIAAFLHRID